MAVEEHGDIIAAATEAGNLLQYTSGAVPKVVIDVRPQQEDAGVQEVQRERTVGSLAGLPPASHLVDEVLRGLEEGLKNVPVGALEDGGGRQGG